MKTHILSAALLAAILAGCGVDSTPQSGGATGASSASSPTPAPAAVQEEKKDEPKVETDKSEGEKKAD